MTKVVVRTDDVVCFFSRAKDAARRADQRQAFEGKVTLSFEDLQRTFTVLSVARRLRAWSVQLRYWPVQAIPVTAGKARSTARILPPFKLPKIVPIFERGSAKRLRCWTSVGAHVHDGQNVPIANLPKRSYKRTH